MCVSRENERIHVVYTSVVTPFIVRTKIISLQNSLMEASDNVALTETNDLLTQHKVQAMHDFNYFMYLCTGYDDYP